LQRDDSGLYADYYFFIPSGVKIPRVKSKVIIIIISNELD